MSENKFIDKNHARLEDQKQVMEQIDDDGVCPFCEENLAKYHKKEIIEQGDYWLLTENQWPYDNTLNHYLVIYKEHIEHINDLSPEAGRELIELFQLASKKGHIKGGGLTMRFGVPNEDGNYGSTVTHLHAHLIEPDLSAGEKVKFKIGHPNNID
ncbi:MAG: HIT domain-containing protein [Candidatus Paceibacterota bacterium]